MCGIAGFINPNGSDVDTSHALGLCMANQIRHRGPDDEGVWIGLNGSVVLSHRRLSILDLSIAGHQPMLSVSGRYVITFNGEIYNHLALRTELRLSGYDISWRGHSDTETLLSCIEMWGLDSTLKKCVGMFAFVVWDNQNNTLSLARDRCGEKPLYYGWQNGVFLFGSELKSLRVHPAFKAEINRNSLALYIRYKHIPAPHSIYLGINKLSPGTYLTISLDRPDLSPTPEPYWQLQSVLKNDNSFVKFNNDVSVINQLDKVLKNSIESQMLADVPVGAFLSGGIDSSLVVALMQSVADKPVNTFTVGFSEARYNEAEYARAVAQHLGSMHTEVYVSGQEALNVVDLLPRLYDEPFADSSQIPTFLISKVARQHVSVALSGDGADELFGGYERYGFVASIQHKLRHFPASFKQYAAKFICSLSPATWDRIFTASSILFPARIKKIQQIGIKAHKLANTFSASSQSEMYQEIMSFWRQPEEIVLGIESDIQDVSRHDDWPASFTSEEIMMFLDTLIYLPDDILVKVDRASMAVSLETRAPFLDHRVVENAWQIPLDMKIRNGQGKWILRQVLNKYVPLQLVNRPKMGFEVPIDEWLRGPLKEWGSALLDKDRIQQENYFNPDLITKKWREHQSGKSNWQNHLWNILMFQAWLEEQGKIK